MSDQQQLITQLENLLRGGSAHAGFKEAIEGLPHNLRGVKPDRLPYSIWQLVEHIRIAQWDMLAFCRDANHVSPKWPDEYWPKEPAPPGEEAWDKSIRQINDELEEFIRLLHEADLYKPLSHGSGQSVLLEALQLADHNAYHTAEIIVIRRLLGAWKPA
ncbi:MAG: DinB family protein [Williamsia sp.]|nr:DinB family protein [Williamsia sp.]